jgi:type III pantothenate kinase
VVVDAGSAITVDVMEEGRHLGGFILPRVYSFLQMFGNISDRLISDIEWQIDLNKLPKSTDEALNFAIFSSIVRSVESVREGRDLYLCGGDGERLVPFFKGAIYRKDLVFEGMKRVIKECGC